MWCTDAIFWSLHFGLIKQNAKFDDCDQHVNCVNNIELCIFSTVLEVTKHFIIKDSFCNDVVTYEV